MGTSRNVADLQDGIADDWSFSKRLMHLAGLEAIEIAEVADHASNVARTSALIAEHLGMGDGSLEDLYFSARWHDIGKLAVEKDILFKPGRLTPEEFNEIKLHTSAGVDLLGPNAPKMLVDVTAFHHERYDGFGYHGLKGEDIPLTARIVAVADVHDALVSKREYKDPMPEQDALMLMTGDVASPGFGRRGFDPIVLRNFIGMRLNDPAFVASNEKREALAAYRDSDPMKDLSPEAITEGWVLKKSGHRLKYENGHGVPKLELMLDPAGHQSYRRRELVLEVEMTDAAPAYASRGM
jgi:HD-GYP domain-containing protein (c-di-GMP phosphodiesterase class II)